MVNNMEFLEGTFLADIFTYTGELREIPDSPDGLILTGEKEIGEMHYREKLLFTLVDIKRDEMQKIFEEVSGKKIHDLNEDVLGALLHKEENKSKLALVENLAKQEEILQTIMWSLIDLRYPTKVVEALVLRPGYKIVSGKISKK
jgi:hypothetical protein